MFSDRPFTKFETAKERTDYMRKYGFIKSDKSFKSYVYFVYEKRRRKCQIIGYEENYDDWSIAVVDFGYGAYFIHTDYLLDMQTVTREFKGEKLDDVPNSFVLFDLETTGTNIYECEIIQISAIKVENLEIVDTYSTFVKPEEDIPDEIIKLTGITPLDVFTAPTIEEVLPEFLNFVGRSVVTGYNIQRFDLNLIYDWNMLIYEKPVKNNYVDFIYNFKDMIEASGNKLKNYKETSIAEYLGISTEGAHNALTDCKICLEIYKKLIHKEEIPTAVIEIEETEDGKEIGRNIANNPVEQAIVEMIDRLIKEYKLPEDGLYLSVNERQPDKKTGKPKLPTKTIAIHEPAYPPMAYDTQGFNVRVTTIEPKEYKTQEDMLFIKVRPLKYERNPYEGTNEVSIRKSKNKETGEEEIVEYIVKCKLDDISVIPWLEQLTRYAIEHYVASGTFGCCSKQQDCIEAGECLHVNRLYACGCMQRRRLSKPW